MLIFDSRPDPERHPDRLRTIARLKGLQSKPVSRARVLDIGCGTGLDILAHALLYPNAEFVGIDLSQEFIDLGKKVTSELKISNVELLCADLKTYSSVNKFDYIICHGVYSWVAPSLQQSIFELVKTLLAAEGLAYISFNALPGWHYRRVAQKLIQLFDKVELTVEQRVDTAIESLNKALLALSDASDPAAEILKKELTACLKQSPAFIYHELLNFDCQPEYLSDFVDKATSYGLQYLGDGRPSRMRTNRFTDAEQKRVAQIGLAALDEVNTEQFWDLLSPPSLRGTILCQADQTLSGKTEYSHIMDMYVTSGLTPESTQLDCSGSKTEVFSNPRELLVEVNEPQLKTTLAALAKHWPNTLAVRDLIGMPEIANVPTDEFSGPRTPLLVTLGEYFLQGLIQLYSEALPSSAEITAKPKVFALASSQAKIGFAWVTNSRFEYVPITEFDRELMQCLDGSNDVKACQKVLLEKVKSGKIETSIAEDHKAKDLAELIEAQIAASLEHYRETGLLVS